MESIIINVDPMLSEVQTRGIRTRPIKSLIVYESVVTKGQVIFKGVGVRNGRNLCLRIPKKVLGELAKKILADKDLVDLHKEVLNQRSGV